MAEDPGYFDLNIQKGQDYVTDPLLEFWIEINDVVRDLTGCTAYLVINDELDLNAKNILTIAMTIGGTSDSNPEADGNILRAELPSAQTVNLDADNGVYDVLLIVPSGEKEYPLKGKVKFHDTSGREPTP